jgi:hypothetical protein
MAKKLSNQKRPQVDKSPIHLESFGCATELRFGRHGTIRIQLNTVEFERLLDALAVFEIRSKRMPKYKILAAVETLKKGFGVLSESRACVTADVVIAAHGVRLEPINMTIDEKGNLIEWVDEPPREKSW